MQSPTSKTMGLGVMALGLAYIVLSILSAILCLYSYNFLLKQRNQEFGLYNILGMNKRQITGLSTIELGISYLITVVLGSLLSAVFSNFFYIIFVNLINYDDLNFKLSPSAFVITSALFAVIFLVLEIVNIIYIRKTSALNLFNNQSQGEREPRGNIILAIISILTIGYGYYLSVSSGNTSAILAITHFFQAILLVIVGTYLFFISFMSWYLKLRRKNKNYYYKPEHFVTLSQMIFRMKQNAVGLANITLLAIMAFVTIFSTIALYSSNENLVKASYPKESVVTISNVSNRQEADDVFQNNVLTPLKTTDGSTNAKFTTYMMVNFTVNFDQKNKAITVDKDIVSPSSYDTFSGNVGILEVMTQDDFRAAGNKLSTLSEGELAFYNLSQDNPTNFKSLNWFGADYKNIHHINAVNNIELINSAIPAGILIVSNDEALENMRTVYNQYANYPMSYTFSALADLDKQNDQILKQIASANNSVLYSNEQGVSATYSTAAEYRTQVLQMSGGFLFTGFVLGIAFLLGAALIIYYKQLSEGTQDKRSYKILQEVGMSLNQVKKTINSQIILVFFMPLLVAIVHFVFALPILRKLLLFFGVTGDQFIYTVCGLTILGILIIYFIIYKLTSRTYYKIIER